MRTIALSLVAAAGILSGSSWIASAMPVDGAAIAHIGQQVDPVISVKTKKPKTKTSTNPAPCPPTKNAATVPANADRHVRRLIN